MYITESTITIHSINSFYFVVSKPQTYSPYFWTIDSQIGNSNEVNVHMTDTQIEIPKNKTYFCYWLSDNTMKFQRIYSKTIDMNKRVTIHFYEL